MAIKPKSTKTKVLTGKNAALAGAAGLAADLVAQQLAPEYAGLFSLLAAFLGG